MQAAMPSIVKSELVEWFSDSWTLSSGNLYYCDKTISKADLSRTIIHRLDFYPTIQPYAANLTLEDDSTARMWTVGVMSGSFDASAMLLTYGSGVKVQRPTLILTGSGQGVWHTDSITIDEVQSVNRWAVIENVPVALQAAAIYTSGTWACFSHFGFSLSNKTTLDFRYYTSGTGTGDDTYPVQLISW